jgi:hypothetical protein
MAGQDYAGAPQPAAAYPRLDETQVALVHRDLHNHVSARLERALIPLRRVAVTTVRFQLDD